MRTFFKYTLNIWVVGVVISLIGSAIFYYWQNIHERDVKRAEIIKRIEAVIPVDGENHTYKEIKVTIHIHEDILKKIEEEPLLSLHDLLAKEQQALGNLYLQQAEYTNDEELIRKALAFLQKSKSFYTKERYPKEHAISLIGIANAHLALSDTTRYKYNHDEALTYCKQIIQIPKIKNYPIELAKAYGIMGVIYDDLARQEHREENYKKAIDSYNQALQYTDKKKNPNLFWKVTFNINQAKLGFASRNNDRGRIKDAISYLEKISLNKEDDLYNYLLVKINLARAYQGLFYQTNTLDDALKTRDAFNYILQDATFKKKYPYVFASAQEEQASMDHILGVMTKDKNYFTEALQLLEESVQSEWFSDSVFLWSQNISTQAGIYFVLDTQADLIKAVDLYTRAIDAYNEYPYQYMNTKSQRGLVYKRLYFFDNKNTRYIDSAINDFKDADSIAIKQKDNQRHILLQEYLAVASMDKYSITKDKNTLIQAKKAAFESLKRSSDNINTPYFYLLKEIISA